MLRWLVVLMVGLVACDQPKDADTATAAGRMPGDVIDSILPMEEYERRFREGLTEVTALTGGRPTIEAITREVLAAVAARDTSALAALAMTRAEFAYLIFPSHIYRDKPYELDPGLFWMQIQQGSSKGAGQLLNHFGGRTLLLQDVSCTNDTLQVRGDDRLRLWGSCQVTLQANDSTITGRIFGSIVERDGTMKLLSYANDF